jgi:hypothetical protein
MAATLTALSLLAGSAALVYGGSLATSIANPSPQLNDQPVETGVPLQPVPQFNYQPVATDASGVPLQPVQNNMSLEETIEAGRIALGSPESIEFAKNIGKNASDVPLKSQPTGRYIDPQDASHSLGAQRALEAQEAMLRSRSAPAAEEDPGKPETDGADDPQSMSGGAVGRPTWGTISSNVLVPQDTTIGATVTAALGIKEDPRSLNEQIFLVERELEAANFNQYSIDDKIKIIMAKYTVERKKFAEKFAQSKNYELTAADYLKKLNNQGQKSLSKEEKNRLTAIINGNGTAEEKAEAKKKQNESSQAKEVPEETLKSWRDKYTDAISKKIEADDDKTDAERDKNKLFAEITELRTKKDEQEKLAKELTVKRNALLVRLQGVLTQKQKKEPQPLDMPARTQRYANALAAKKVAEDNLRRFYSNIWLPLNDDQIAQSKYKNQFDSLTNIWKNANSELELAQAGLTAPAQVSNTNAQAEFSAFASDVTNITRDAVNRNGTIKPDYEWQPDTPGQENIPLEDPGRKRGYPKAVNTLKEYASKPNLQIAANIYYEIAFMETDTLIRNIPRFLDYLKKLKGTGIVRSERERPVGFSLKGDVTNIVLKEFIERVVELAANSVRSYPRPDEVDSTNPQAIIYSQLRDKTNDFVDKQIYLLNKMFKVIKKARKDTKPSDIQGKNLLELEEKLNELYRVPNNVPPKGMCERIFKPSTFEYLSTGIFKNKDILKEVLEDPVLKDDFLDAIGFIKVSNFLDAKEYARKAGGEPLLRKAAFAEYNQKIQKEAFNNPTGTVYHDTSARENSVQFSERMTRGDLLRLDISNFVDRGNGNLITNKEYARQIALRSETPLLKFIPGIFLEAARLADNGSRMTTVEPLSNFRDACETDGNVGQGSEQTNRILDILDELAKIEISPKQDVNPLLKFIKKLEDMKKIDITRPDQAEPQSSLKRHGFNDGIGNWAIMNVIDNKKDLNFIQTFLTFRSSKFRSIPYNDTTVYRGKTVNTREVYANLALEEIEKMPSFQDRDTDEKKNFPSDSDWQKLSDDFHLNFVIYSDNRGVGVADRSMATRPNAPVYNVFKAKNGRYYPIRMNAGSVIAPYNPPGAAGPTFVRANRDIPSFLGGAIDGVEFPVTKLEEQETTKDFLHRTVVKPVVKGANAVGSAVDFAGNLIPPIVLGSIYTTVGVGKTLKYVLATGAKYVGQPLYKFVNGVWKKLTEEEVKDFTTPDKGAEEKAERDKAAAEARGAQQREKFVPVVIPEPTAEEVATLKAKLIEISNKPNGFTDDQTTTIFKLLKFNLRMDNVGKDEFIRIIQKSGIDPAKVVRTLVRNLHPNNCQNERICSLIFNRVMAMYGFKNDGGNINLGDIYRQVFAPPPVEPGAGTGLGQPPPVEPGAGTGLGQPPAAAAAPPPVEPPPVEPAPAPAPAPGANPFQQFLQQGGRRKTSNWRRSKPVRYTRRKF